ncbi:MAG: transposase, partial [Rhodopila sp.]
MIPKRRALLRHTFDPCTTAAEAIGYALRHWDGLDRFLEDGRIELDNNSVERAMRPVCLSRKNSLFAGSDEGGENWAC